jgi:hypothetical protein
LAMMPNHGDSAAWLATNQPADTPRHPNGFKALFSAKTAEGG